MRLFIQQQRGETTHTSCMGSAVVPRVGEWVEVRGAPIAGRVKEVKYSYLFLPAAPRELDSVTVELEGWFYGFGKD